MSSDVLVSEHVPPNINGAIYHQMKVSLLLKQYGYRINTCGYCGEPKLSGYKPCRCGYVQDTNDKGEPVWKKK